VTTGKKTDNSFLMDKVMLRVKNLPEGEIHVLDCYAGKGLIWTAVEKLANRPVIILPIDRRPDKSDFHLVGDNMQYLETLDLSRYNCIDLDAYGVPFDQIECLHRRKYKGVVFVTVVQSVMGQMPHELLQAVGFTPEQIEKCPTLFGKRGWQYLLEWLAKIGVKTIRHRSSKRKHCLCFTMQ
jgi:hypothetical protein